MSNELVVQETVAELQQLFTKFSISSQRLEAKHEALLQETEDLRRRLKEKEAEIKRNQRLTALGETAAGIAHEIRNPLCSIKLFVSLLRQEVFGNSAATEYVEQIENGMLRLDAVISNILHFSKDKLPSLSVVNMNNLLSDVVQQFRNANPENLTVNMRLEANPFILGNDAALRQVVANLLNNAKQASEPHACVVDLCGSDEGNDFCLKIKNFGPDIPEDILPRLFEPFVSNKVSGTGLGLAIVMRLVCQHGGSITAKNTGNGPEFTIILPRQNSGVTRGGN